MSGPRVTRLNRDNVLRRNEREYSHTCDCLCFCLCAYVSAFVCVFMCLHVCVCDDLMKTAIQHFICRRALLASNTLNRNQQRHDFKYHMVRNWLLTDRSKFFYFFLIIYHYGKPVGLSYRWLWIYRPCEASFWIITVAFKYCVLW